MCTITDSHADRGKKITAVLSSSVTFQGKSLTQLFVRSYVTAWWTTEVQVLVSTFITLLSKWNNLVAPCTRRDERSKHA